MSLELHWNELMEKLLSDRVIHSVNTEQLIGSIDSTLLDEQASSNALNQLKEEGNKNQVAALCVFMHHLSELSLLNSIDLATVINFPLGDEELSTSLASIDKAAQLGAVEIDYVFPYLLYHSDQHHQAMKRCHAVSNSCKEKKLILKIILETATFPNGIKIFEVSKELADMGCDFIKTSTGTLPGGASLSAALAILSAIKETNTSCGIKISGGIKKPEQAFHYARLAELMINKPINKQWFRIGTSSLLNELVTK